MQGVPVGWAACLERLRSEVISAGRVPCRRPGAAISGVVQMMAGTAACACRRISVSGPRGSFGDGRAMRTAVASKFRQSAGDGTLRIGEMRGSHPCAWHSAAATCGAAVALSALASLLGDWGRSPQQAGACLTLWSEVPEENWPFLLKILAMSVMGAGDALAMSPRRLPSFSQPWLAMAFGQSPARAVFWPDFASIWRFRQLSETLRRMVKVYIVAAAVPLAGERSLRDPAILPYNIVCCVTSATAQSRR